jgi:hypothetical protein
MSLIKFNLGRFLKKMRQNHWAILAVKIAPTLEM